MSIIQHVGPDTISRLESDSKRRCAEADWLVEGKHYLAALYFYGYVAEITLGAAYFRLKGWKTNESISEADLKGALNRARPPSLMSDKSHPVDGLALLLIEEKAALYAPAYEKRIERLIRDRSSAIGENWGPKLRYRAIDVTEDQVSLVRTSAHWFDNSHKL